jgi:hypothetical protein
VHSLLDYATRIHTEAPLDPSSVQVGHVVRLSPAVLAANRDL